MKKRNRRNIIILSVICAIIMIVAAVYSTSNTQNITLNKNNSEAIQLNEEYTKDDFVISSDGRVLVRLSDVGKEKLSRNDGKLVLNGNVLGNITRIGNYRNNKFFSNIDITEIEFRNLEKLTTIINAFNNTKLKKVDLTSLIGLENIDESFLILK